MRPTDVLSVVDGITDRPAVLPIILSSAAHSIGINHYVISVIRKQYWVHFPNFRLADCLRGVNTLCPMTQIRA